MKAANKLPKDMQKHIINGNKTEPDPLGDVRRRGLPEFCHFNRAYQLKTYRYRLVEYVSWVRGTYDLDKIIAADLYNRKINPDQTCLQSTNPKIRTAMSVVSKIVCNGRVSLSRS